MTGPKILVWAFINIPSFLGIRCSHRRLVPNFLEQAYTIWPRPSSTSLFSVISKSSGETVRMCRLAWSFAARICKKYLDHITGINNLAEAFIYISFSSAISEGSGETVQMCRLAWSFTARICDKYINRKNKWPQPSFTSLLLSAISEGSGKTAQMCCLARSFAARICDFFMNWSINLSLSLHPHPFIFRYSLFAYAIGTNRSWIGV